MTHRKPEDDETVELPVHRNCPYIKEKDSWLNSQLMKYLLIGYGIALGPVTWMIVSIIRIDKDLEITKEKVEMALEIRQDMKIILSNINEIKLDVNTLKVKVNP